VDIVSVFLCGVMWCGHRHEEADTQLLRATLSRDPEPPMFLSEVGPKSSKTEIVLKTLRPSSQLSQVRRYTASPLFSPSPN
jgi:hypothetical protein